MVRGPGKYKQKRGGGRNFSKDMSFDNGDRSKTRGDGEDIEEEGSEEESEEEESGEEESEEESGEEGKPELTRIEKRELKKKEAAAKQKKPEGEEEDEDLINPNHVQKKLNISDLNEPRELTRREREQKEKADAKERYWKLHQQGKTDEAKADLSRLAKIRADREAAQAKRKAEAEAKAQEAEAKKQAQLTKRG